MKSKSAGSVQAKEGQLIITEGELEKEMYIIEEGKVEIVKRVGKGERQLRVLEPGDFFGEMAILDDQPRSASARAITDCKLLLIDPSTFDQMLRQYPEIAVRMLRKLSQRLREAGADPESGPSPVEVKKPAVEVKKLAPAAPPPSASLKPAAAPAKAPAARAGPKAAAAPVEKSAPAASKRSRPPPVAAEPAKAPAPVGSGTLFAFDSGVQFFLPEKQDIKVGRFDSVTGIHPDIDLGEIDTYKTTSRRHASILREGEKLFVYEEIGTSNGTYVNGKRIRTGAKSALKNGDWVQFGGVKMIFRAG